MRGAWGVPPPPNCTTLAFVLSKGTQGGGGPLNTPPPRPNIKMSSMNCLKLLITSKTCYQSKWVTLQLKLSAQLWHNVQRDVRYSHRRMGTGGAEGLICPKLQSTPPLKLSAHKHPPPLDIACVTSSSTFQRG